MRRHLLLTTTVVMLALASLAAKPSRRNRPKLDLDRWQGFSVEVEALLKRKMCPALRGHASTLGPLLDEKLAAPDLSAGETETIAQAPLLMTRTRFDASPQAVSPAAFAEGLERYLAPIAVRTRCSIGYDRFELLPGPGVSGLASFGLLLSGLGPAGRPVQDSGRVEARLERVPAKGPGVWRITELTFAPRVRVRAERWMFVDVTRSAGLDPTFEEPEALRGNVFLAEDLDRGGLAVEDVDGDGDLDIYVAVDGPNLLYVNNGDGTFTESAQKLGVADRGNGRGVLMVDLDGDGDREILVANRRTDSRWGGLVLYRSAGGRFHRVKGFARRHRGAYMHLTAGDVDGDGDLDIHVSAYGVQARKRYINFLDDRQGEPDLLLINEGKLRFNNRARAWGIADRRWTYAATLVDLTSDGFPELVIADDFGRKRIYRNVRGKRFVEVSRAGPGQERANGMGVAIADIDGDGFLDIYFGNMHSNAGKRLAFALPKSKVRTRIQKAAAGNTLWMGDGKLGFTEQSRRYRVDHGGWAWGVKLFDLDLDGRIEAYSPCGFFTTEQLDDL